MMIANEFPDLHKLFPDDFVWGVATSAFQIEGAALTDGKGASIWDTFCAVPDAIIDQSNGLVAGDHYHRLDSDLDLIAGLGVDAYRFSISWPRVRPAGTGAWNEAGLQFYERLIDGLCQRRIQPHLTLNHWDLPQALQATGGWENRETVAHFVEYAIQIAKRFGERVASITTHNEPWVIAILGHETGIFAPGVKSRASAMQVSHHLLLSHGLALQAIRATGCTSQLGIAFNLSPTYPVTDSAADRAQAHLEDGLLLRWYFDPIFNGSYPQDVLDYLGSDGPLVVDGDLANINVPVDFIGINYYTRSMVSATQKWDVRLSDLEKTDMAWEIYPQGLTDLLLRLHQDYPMPPMYITENGGAFKDTLTDGQIHDTNRTRYIAQHIAAVADAIKLGVNMAGYMVWSLFDNFEWTSGYTQRFGIVHIDFLTQDRILKDSALWYRQLLRQKRG